MKKTGFIILLLMLAAFTLPAQPNIGAAPDGQRGPTHIESDSADFDLIHRRAVYVGNVRVSDPQMRLTCGELTADLPQNGGRIDHMIARTKVVMDSVDDKGQTNHATCDEAIYSYSVADGVTNEAVTLTGHAMAEDSQVILYGEPIIYNRATGGLTASNQHMIIKQSLATALARTNPPAAATHVPQAPTNLTPARTSLPPGAAQSANGTPAPPTKSAQPE